MTTHFIVLRKRLLVLQALGTRELRSAIAEREQLSRTTVREWRDLWETHGEKRLHDRLPRRRPVVRNQAPLEVELVIVDHTLAHPEQGPKTIAAFHHGRAAVYWNPGSRTVLHRKITFSARHSRGQAQLEEQRTADRFMLLERDFPAVETDRDSSYTIPPRYGCLRGCFDECSR